MSTVVVDSNFLRSPDDEVKFSHALGFREASWFASKAEVKKHIPELEGIEFRITPKYRDKAYYQVWISERDWRSMQNASQHDRYRSFMYHLPLWIVGMVAMAFVCGIISLLNADSYKTFLGLKVDPIYAFLIGVAPLGLPALGLTFYRLSRSR